MSDSDDESRAGSDFGHYRLRRLIGRGGMGEVYEAEDTRRDRIVALKLLPATASHDPVFRTRLQREAHSAGRLQEPHVVPIHDYGEIDGQMYVDMRFIDGANLRTILSRYGPMDPARSVAIIRQVASALDAAHAAGITHRDVKPENVLITRDDFAYLVDFGIANATTDERLTELGTAVGTYGYMAPERFSEGEVTSRADVYALACVLYECLTGGQPYPVDSVSVAITSHIMKPIPQPSKQRPGIPQSFDDVVARGMAKKPEDRYASAGDLAMAANQALTLRDRDEAEDILARGEAATLPGKVFNRPLGLQKPTPPPGGQRPTPSPQRQTPPPQHRTPPPNYRTPPPQRPTPPPHQPTPAPYPAYAGSPPVGPPSTPRQAAYGSFPPGPPAWGPQPPQPPGKKRNPWILVAAVVAVIAVIAAIVGIAFAVGGSDDSDVIADPTTTTTTTRTTTRTTTSRTTTTTTAPPAGDAYARLVGLLPPGYSESNCDQSDKPLPDALATATCGAATGDGPTAAFFALYPDVATLQRSFDDLVKLDSQLLVCPGTQNVSPISWHYKDTPTKPEGRIACGVYKDRQAITWYKESTLFLADTQGSDIGKLHDWWYNAA